MRSIAFALTLLISFSALAAESKMNPSMLRKPSSQGMTKIEVGACVDKVINQAIAVVLTKSISGEKVGGWQLNSFVLDYENGDYGYVVSILGRSEAGAKIYKFGAVPAEKDCIERLIEL